MKPIQISDCPCTLYTALNLLKIVVVHVLSNCIVITSRPCATDVTLPYYVLVVYVYRYAICHEAQQES